MENDLRPPVEDAMMTSEKRIEIGTTCMPSYQPFFHNANQPTLNFTIIYNNADQLLIKNFSLINQQTLDRFFKYEIVRQRQIQITDGQIWL